MSNFINTADVIGDELLTAQIIDRTITEYKDNIITTLGTWNSYAIAGCTNLTHVSIPLVEDFYGSAFSGCTALESLEAPRLKYIRNGMCDGFASLKSVSFPNADLTAETNPGTNAFKNCRALESVSLPKLTQISAYMFINASSLEQVHIPAVKKICGYGFYNATALKKISLPSLELFDADWTIFSGTQLEALILPNSDVVAQLTNSNTISVTPIGKGNGYIYVPSALLEDYKAATNWSEFASQFRALEDYTVDGTITGELDETKI